MAFLRELAEKHLASVGLCALALALGASGCSSTPDVMDDDSTSSGGTGATGNGGTGGNYTPPTCGQECQDYLVSYGLNDTIWFLWNQLIAGHPSGAQDTGGTCPLGGTVEITGTTGVSNGIDTMDVTFAFAACENTDEIYDLTFTGDVTMLGSFDATAETLAITFASDSLVASGALDVYDDPSIDETCPFTTAQNGYGEDGTLVGKVCGRSFNSETVFGSSAGGSGGSGGSGGTTSSGGTGGTGGTGNDCQCFCPDGTDCTGIKTSNPCGVDADGIPEACGCPVDCR